MIQPPINRGRARSQHLARQLAHKHATPKQLYDLHSSRKVEHFLVTVGSKGGKESGAPRAAVLGRGKSAANFYPLFGMLGISTCRNVFRKCK